MLKPVSSYKTSLTYQVGFRSAKTTKQKNNKNTTTTPFIYAGVGLATAFGITAGIISTKQSPAKAIDKITALKNEMAKYSSDITYRKNILREINLPENDYYKLRSIIGVEELDIVIKDLSKDKEHFFPGKKTFRADKEPIFGKENIETGKFAANMHLHTAYSDGTFTVPELMEQAVKYADSRVKKLGQDNPFYLAITDHDTVAGCQEAVEIILKNPEKYKNLRLILGVENSVITNHPQFLNNDVETHMISYGINPFDKDLIKYYDNQVQKNRNNIQAVLDNVNEKYFKILKKYSIDYNLKEFDKLTPQIKYRNMPSNYYTKDYLQFKLIYSSMVEKNEAFLDAVGLNSEMLNFISPQKLIGENLDYSKGQKYYEYYLEAVKKDLKTKLSPDKHKEVDKYLRYIPDEITKILNEIEHSTCNPQSNLYVKPVKHPDFEEAIKFLNTQEGNLGIAHPGVVFPMKNLKSNAETVKFYDKLYADFKNFAKDKARYAEDNYATYFENQTKEFLESLSQTSTKYGLEKTGGLDTHISDIFASK